MVVRYNVQAAKDEKVVAKAIEKAWNVTCNKSGLFEHLDFTLVANNKIVAYAETKARSHVYGTYPTVYFSQRKWLAVKKTGKPGYFVVKFNDGIRAARVDTLDGSKPIWAGRKDRENAPNDMEYIIEIPITRFKKLEEIKIGN